MGVVVYKGDFKTELGSSALCLLEGDWLSKWGNVLGQSFLGYLAPLCQNLDRIDFIPLSKYPPFSIQSKQIFVVVAFEV